MSRTVQKSDARSYFQQQRLNKYQSTPKMFDELPDSCDETIGQANPGPTNFNAQKQPEVAAFSTFAPPAHQRKNSTNNFQPQQKRPTTTTNLKKPQ